MSACQSEGLEMTEKAMDRVKARTTLRRRGVITIPSEVRAAAQLEEGDPIEIEVTDDGILLWPMKLI